MMLSSRRRALMAAQGESTEIIDGSTLTWEQGYISAAGATVASNYVIRTTNYISMSGKMLTYVGPIVNANDVHYYSYVCQYDASYNFISRTLMLSSSENAGRTVILNYNCAYIKISLGHADSLAVNTDPTEGASLTISAVATTRAHGTWDDLFVAIDAGTVASEYFPGESISLTLDSSGGTYAMQIVGINADTLEGSTDKAAVSLISKGCYKTKHRFNPAYSAGTIGTGTLGGWKESELRSYLQNTVLPLIPSNVSNRIVGVKKYTRIMDVSETTVNNELTNDKLWVPGVREMNSGLETSGPNYSSVFSGNSARIKYQYGTTTAVRYYLRSNYTKSDFYAIATTGALNNLTANASSGYFPFGFCVN